MVSVNYFFLFFLKRILITRGDEDTGERGEVLSSVHLLIRLPGTGGVPIVLSFNDLIEPHPRDPHDPTFPLLGPPRVRGERIDEIRRERLEGSHPHSRRPRTSGVFPTPG